jgi:hypothetical protein
MRALLLMAWICGVGCTATEPIAADGGAGDAADLAGCATSCDCPAGQTCAGGSCIDGIVAVYCCSSESCPTAAVCQAPNGEVSLCGGAPAMTSP